MFRPQPERGKFLHQPKRYGTSVLGQPLEYFPSENETKLLIIAGMHGEEADTGIMLSRALRTLDHQSPCAAVIIGANPDGLTRGTRANANGVDLNRNFPSVDWKPEPTTHRWTLEDESDVELSPGESPASEPETQALIELIDELQPDQLIALHSPLAYSRSADSIGIQVVSVPLARRAGECGTTIASVFVLGGGSWSGASLHPGHYKAS